MKQIIALLSISFFAVTVGVAQEGTIFTQEGLATWYGEAYRGQPTASGEVFDPDALTAAHPILPFGTLLRVTNIKNQRQVVVRVNDRGPFVSSRIIDLSQAAAQQLGLPQTGVADVIIESLTPVSINPVQLVTEIPAPELQPRTPVQPAPSTAQSAPSTAQPDPSAVSPTPAAQAQQAPQRTAAEVKPAMPPLGTNKRYRLQIGSFRVARNAVSTFDRLKTVGLNPAYEKFDSNENSYYRVVLAGIRAEDVAGIAEKLATAGFYEVLIREER
ncbi:MAG: septal ring lytic transglycosylase RlpA family protein [Treponema sp.]|jgi:rare lipoprotein A|nr:septal ring lytic transglycosylase RlpA family protein [Treponema sp.]